MTRKIIARKLKRLYDKLFGIHLPSRIFSGPPKDINAITEMAPCPQCGEVPMMSYCCGEIYYRMTTSGVLFFNCIHCNASITFSRTGEDMSPEEAKKRFNRRMANKMTTEEVN